MSLDIYLDGEPEEMPCECLCGHKHTKTVSPEYYHRNITHNLGLMAEEAGIYRCLWRPEELEIHQAGQLVPLLTEGLRLLRSDPERFKKFNSSNGWGSYDGLVEFVAKYLEACEKWPFAKVNASR